MKHQSAVNVLGTLWLCFVVLLIPHSVQAASLAEYMGVFDFVSLGWAAGCALAGGLLRTILTLATDARPVLNVLREAIKDSLVSLIAGAVVHLLLEAIRATGAVPIPGAYHVAALVLAGWLRMSMFGWLNTLVTRLSGVVADSTANFVKGWLDRRAQETIDKKDAP